ncbi:MAG: hypothetical protein ACI841_003326 [Planctomycetota bacterium]|jgi:hypothetical protein
MRFPLIAVPHPRRRSTGLVCGEVAATQPSRNQPHESTSAMKYAHQLSLTTAALMTLFSVSNAQSLHFDGLLNSPLGSSTIAPDGTGRLTVSNIGSSGLDGVRINLGDSQGGSVSTTMSLAPQGACIIDGELGQTGTTTTFPVSLTMTYDAASDETTFRPDFSSLGQQTYRLRIMHAGQVVFDEGGNTGTTRMSNIPIEIPEKLYLFLPDWVGGPNYPSFCGFTGGNVTPPGSATAFPCDIVEFIGQPAPIQTVESISVRVVGPPQFTVDSEDLRFFGTTVTGIDDVHLTTSSGKLKVSNLGSSGCDGVSIAVPDGENEISAEAEEISAPNNSGSTITLESNSASSVIDLVTCEETAGEWLFSPNFNGHGASTYTLEMFDAGQMVFAQSGMSGPAVSTARFSLFYKKTTEHPDGTVTTEWCIGGSSSAAHRVAGGPTIVCDMFTLRSEGGNVQPDDIQTLSVRGANTTTDIVLLSVAPPAACVGTNYCLTSPNSAGSGAIMCSTGSSSVAANDLVLTCSGMPTGQFGIFFYGPNQIQAPFGNGFRCVGGATNRLPILNAGTSGSISYALDNTSPPSASGQISAGQVWNFQCWYRDPVGGGSSFNLSDGHSIIFLP